MANVTLVSKKSIILGIVPLLSLSACTFERGDDPQGLGAGEVRFLSVEYAGPDPAALLLPNGSFDGWYAGLPAPTGFQAPANPEISTLLRDAKSEHLGTTGYTARETWYQPGIGSEPESRFHTIIELKPETVYGLDVVASASPGMGGGIGAYETDEDGQWAMLARDVVVVTESAPTRYSGTFTTKAGGRVLLASHADAGSTFPGTITWSSWDVQPAEQAAPLATVADDPARRALMRQAVAQVRGQLAVYGGVEAWGNAVQSVKWNVKRIRQEAEPQTGASVLGYNQWIFRKAELEQFAATTDLTRDPDGRDRPAWDALVQAERELSARGVQLVLVPVPQRLSFYIEEVHKPAADGPVLFQTHTALVERMLRGDLLALDVAPRLRHAQKLGEAVFWRTDYDIPSHTLKIMAGEVAPVVAGLLGSAPDPADVAYTEAVDVLPLAQRLVPELMPGQQGAIDGEERRIYSVRAPDGGLFTPPSSSAVLAAGSYAVVHQPRGASFAAHLSRALGFPVAIPAKNLEDPEVLAYLLSGPSEMASVQVVVYCFPEMALAGEGWQ